MYYQVQFLFCVEHDMILGRDASLRRGLVLQVVCTLLHHVQAGRTAGNVGEYSFLLQCFWYLIPFKVVLIE